MTTQRDLMNDEIVIAIGKLYPGLEDDKLVRWLTDDLLDYLEERDIINKTKENAKN